jgi:hypothetical protein
MRHNLKPQTESIQLVHQLPSTNIRRCTSQTLSTILNPILCAILNTLHSLLPSQFFNTLLSLLPSQFLNTLHSLLPSQFPPQPVLQHSSQPTLQPDPQHSPHIGSGILSVSDIQEQRTRTASSALQWDCKPSLSECQNLGIVSKLASNWNDLAIYLGLEDETDNIDSDYRKVREKCKNTLKLWIKGKGRVYSRDPITWRTLYKVIRKIHPAFADEIQGKFVP